MGTVTLLLGIHNHQVAIWLEQLHLGKPTLLGSIY